jgi:hypothetical protein
VDLPSLAELEGPSESIAPPVGVPAPHPTHCDVCAGPIGESEYVTIAIVLDETPRELREKRGGGFLEQEWNLEAVCPRCDYAFRQWLFREMADASLRERAPRPTPLVPPSSFAPDGVDSHEAETWPAPEVTVSESAESPLEAVRSAPALDSEVESIDSDELAPFASPAPNQS